MVGRGVEVLVWGRAGGGVKLGSLLGRVLGIFGVGLGWRVGVDRGCEGMGAER